MPVGSVHAMFAFNGNRERVCPWRDLDENERAVVAARLLVLSRLRRATAQVMEARFGPLEPALRERIAAADGPTLAAWGRRVSTAGSVGEILDGDSSS